MLEQLRQEIETLSSEEQERLLVLIHELKTTSKTADKILNESGFIGCCSLEEDLSSNDKQAPTEGWTQKQEHKSGSFAEIDPNIKKSFEGAGVYTREQVLELVREVKREMALERFGEL
ncbi:hypothetical protein [Spirulina subsalsa]|uniref:hypothetical protein n=1 Tax=Spirulina subsalsa TaxID=54311 RepID=UPI00031635AF|nr:hypothetical protein [Spirulina subsalsa]